MRANSKSSPDAMISLLPPPPFDRQTFVQKAKLKTNQICQTVL
jgi:hypothetical protein